MVPWVGREVSTSKPGFWVLCLVGCAWVAMFIFSASGRNVWGVCFPASATLEGYEQSLVCHPSMQTLPWSAPHHMGTNQFPLQGPLWPTKP